MISAQNSFTDAREPEGKTEEVEFPTAQNISQQNILIQGEMPECDPDKLPSQEDHE